MPVPNIINDGNWGLQFVESKEYEFPFAEKGDNVTFKATLSIKLDKNSFRPTAAMSVLNDTLGQCFLTNPGRPRDIGCGLYQFTQEYCSLPATRTECGSFTYTLQAYASISSTGADPSKYFYDVSWDLEEQTFTVPTRFVYEYYAFTPPNPLLKSRLYMQFGRLYSIGGAPANGNLIVAEDSQVSIYAGLIYERRTPYVQVSGQQIPNPS